MAPLPQHICIASEYAVPVGRVLLLVPVWKLVMVEVVEEDPRTEAASKTKTVKRMIKRLPGAILFVLYLCGHEGVISWMSGTDRGARGLAWNHIIKVPSMD